MAKNKETVINHYSSYKEDERANSSKANSLEFHYTKKLIGQYMAPDANIIELGCGTGYYAMHFADACNAYWGVDLSPDNIAVFSEKIAAAKKENVHAVVGDATDLSAFSDNSFDMVICLGPMYHLPKEERAKVFKECLRIAKKGAVLAFAYINSIGVYAGWCLNDQWRHIYPNEKANKHFLEHKTADECPDLFFYTSPEEMEKDAKEFELEVIQNCGLDFFFAESAINDMSDEQFRLYMELSDQMHNSPSCTGLADHALMICRK